MALSERRLRVSGLAVAAAAAWSAACHAGEVTGADGYIVALFTTGCVQTGKVDGIMGEIGIHLKDIVVGACQRPSEPEDIGCSQPQLPFSLLDE